MTHDIRVATRRSQLALSQARSVAAALEKLTGRETVLVPVVSEGDVRVGSLTGVGLPGVFTAAVRQAVKDGDADVAVHSLKDLPTGLDPDVTLAAVPVRADHRDALVGATESLAELPPGAKIGTGSPRRAAQVRRSRPDIRIIEIRGNIDTRFARVSPGDLDAVVVAKAGIDRLGRDDWRATAIDVDEMIPAPGQGALAVETLSGIADSDAGLAHALARLDDRTTRAATVAERSLLAALGAGCSAPVGAYARVHDNASSQEIHLRAVAISVDGADEVQMSTTGAAAEADELGRQLALAMIASGAADLLGEHIK